jgi:predicted transcriptional regulator
MSKSFATSFRLDADTLRMLDDIAADISRKRAGEPVTRSQALRAIVREEHKRRGKGRAS